MSDTGFAARLAAVRGRIDAAARRAHRDPAEITLVGVSKRMPVECVREALDAGLVHVGENYVQEAAAKIDALADGERRVRWHLIGSLQRNKARDAVRLFDVIETIDRASLARELAKRAEAAGRVLPVLVQVNLSREPQKGGVAEEELPSLLEVCSGLDSLDLQGLMTVPALGTPEEARATFAALRELRERVESGVGTLPHLSMGMSRDFEAAVEEGATLVRVGTALFGPRPTEPPG